MTTPRIRAIVSLAAAATLTLALGACARGASPAAWDGTPTTAQTRAPTIRFDNQATVHVHVYVISAQRQWLLGRVEPGARATLRIPAASLAETAGFVRLVVLADAPVSVQAARDPGATFAIAQPASMLLSQRWTFSQGQLAAPQLFGARADVGHP